MLELLENKFLNSKFKTKIELYVLPLLIIYCVFYLYPATDTNHIVYKPIKIDFSNKKFKDSFLELFSIIEKDAKKLNVKILSINQKNKLIIVKGNSSLTNLKKLIIKLESLNNFTNLKLLKIEKRIKAKTYDFELNLSLEKYFIKKKIIKNEYKIEKKSFNLKAIIANYALVDDKWIKIGDFIDSYKLFEIKKDYIKLKNKDDILEIELKNDRFTKYIN